MPRDTKTGPRTLPAPWRCPMCGQAGPRSKEHVWAQWLREHPCVKTELEHWRGERMERPQPVTTLDEQGRYRTEIGTVEHVAAFLPHVTAPVCQTCNTGWMSRLETEVKSMVGPWIVDAEPIRLRPQQQHTIAMWAVKTFMTYALTMAPQSNPFTHEEYAELARSQEPPSRAHVWMYASTSARSAVGMGINSFTVSDGSFDPTTDADNAALGFLAAGHAMFLMVLVPESVPEHLVKAYAPPPAPRRGMMRRISRQKRRWPGLEWPSRGWLFPAGSCDEVHMDAVMAWMELPRHMSISFEGLTPQEKQQAGKDFLAGSSLDTLRSSYLSRIPPRVPLPDELIATKRNSRLESRRLQRRGAHEAAAQGLLVASNLHLDAKDWSNALDLLEEALAITGTTLGEDANVAAARGVCLTQLTRWPEAAAEHQRAIDLGRDTPESRGDLADALTRCGQYARALELLEAPQPDPHEPELPRSELTRAALTYLVDELGITEQDRESIAALPEGLDSLSEQEIRDLLVTVDALAPELWARRETAEEAITFYVARAWWGGRGDHWFVAAAVLHHNGYTEPARHLIRFGFDLSAEMLNAHEQALADLRASDAPDVDELAAVWKQEAQHARDR